MDNFDLRKYLAEGRLHEAYNLDVEFKKAPSQASYEDVLEIVKSLEDMEALNKFKSTFSEDEPINKEDYFKFAKSLSGEIDYITADWISIFDEDVYYKAGLA